MVSGTDRQKEGSTCTYPKIIFAKQGKGKRATQKATTHEYLAVISVITAAGVRLNVRPGNAEDAEVEVLKGTKKHCGGTFQPCKS